MRGVQAFVAMGHHIVVQGLDTFAAGADKQKRKNAVQQTGKSAADHSSC